MTHIVILDNASTYPPLLEYYKNCPHRVVLLGKNAGYMALWESPIFEEFKNDFYVYTDPDLLPIAQCPKDFMEVFLKLLAENADIKKVGFSLKIDDLPDCFPKKQEIVAIESKYWQRKRSEWAYDAPIDTTFALYRPGAKGDHRAKGLRTVYPYVARHLPWYLDPQNLPEEEIYYKQRASDSSTT
ncbi:MAG: glycosyltransferase family 2 protein [Cytophagia bacterium]|nr:MAG: glycosyltransferase family 2 protein [Cytophagales bacterium]TAG35150.1 MAG: glycosyltransferase family 2 protein [Cytophagia bacterium]TAG75087.1 MAG: glycosyltransferase family 2 protein [Runella slithyformis]TAG77083.1 MAG: glycosyltransferase family 2 protein [Cytophagales bacterium]